MTDANVSNADLDAVTLYFVTSGGLTGTPATLTTLWSLTGGYLVGPSAVLSGADLSGVDLSGDDLTNADFANANLSGTKLAGVDLSGADFTGAQVQGVDLSGAVLTNVTSGGLTGLPGALPLNWAMVGGYLIGPGADLDNANLAGRTSTAATSVTPT